MVTSLRFHSQIVILNRYKKIKIYKGPFKEKQLNDKDLVFCATNDAELNKKVVQACLKKRIWVNVVDDSARCSFIVPACIHRGDVTFAISTGGASPALAKYLRKRIEANFGAEVSVLSLMLKKHRSQLLKISLRKRRKILERLINNKILLKLKQGNRLEAEKVFMDLRSE